MSSRALVVSIHDVSPITREAVGAIAGKLTGLGVARTSLLVVPDHHHRADITGDAGFAPWLRRLAGAGHEAVLHGYFHQRERRARESALTRFFTRCYTADEGEFFDIAYNDARALLTRGRDALERCAGITPTGFIAPAWLLSAGGEEAARNLGFAYTTRLTSLTELPSRRVHPSQSLCWSVRSQWRRAVSLSWNRLLFRRLRPNPLLRISIHPPDLGHPAIWDQIQQLVAEALADREPLTYQQFVSRLG